MPPKIKSETETRNSSTQCNLTIRNNLPIETDTRNSSTQCTGILTIRNSLPTETRNSTTQCNMTIRNDLPVRNYPKKEKPPPESTTHIPGIFKLLETMINSSGFALCLTMRKNNRGEQSLIITCPSNLGLLGEDIDPVTVIVTSSGKCTTIIPFARMESTNLLLENVFLEEVCLKVLKKVSGIGYAFCPGIKICGNTPLQHPRLKYISEPFPRVQSTQCLLWHEREKRNSVVALCQHCKLCAQSLKKSMRRKKMMEQKTSELDRCKVESNYSIQRLSPESQMARYTNMKKAQRVLKNRVSQLEKQLARKEFDTQSKEMESVVQINQEDFSDEMETVIHDPPCRKNSQKMTKHDIKMFNEDQQFCGNRWNGNRWNPITMRMALAVFRRSRTAYQALRSFGVLKLPCVQTLIANKQFYSERGPNNLCVQEQEEVMHQQEQEADEKEQEEADEQEQEEADEQEQEEADEQEQEANDSQFYSEFSPYKLCVPKLEEVDEQEQEENDSQCYSEVGPNHLCVQKLEEMHEEEPEENESLFYSGFD